MRLAIVSDIHANLPAWKAVRLDAASMRVDRIICLGDVIGYGPQPAETLEQVYAEVHDFVLGNHEAVVCAKLDESCFNDRARRLAQWTRDHLNPRALRWFEKWPLTLRGPGFRCAHGDLAKPGRFSYVIDPQDALPSWETVPEPLLFVGHSHCAGIYLLGASGTPRRVDPQDAVVEEGKRFLVNVGSVGQPRDGDPRASYCIYDTETRALYFRRVPYDVDAYAEAMRRAGLPTDHDPVLQFDPRKGVPPLRPMLSFRPPEENRQARGCIEVADLRSLQRRVRIWRSIALFGACVLITIGAAAGLWYWRHREERPEEIDRRAFRPLVAADHAPEHNFATVEMGSSPAGAAVPAGWALYRGNRKRQHVEWHTAADGASMARLRSTTTAADLWLRGPRIRVEPGQKFTAEAHFRRGAAWRGEVGLQVLLVRDLAGQPVTDRHFVAKQPNLPRRDGWLAARETFTIPAGGREIELQIGGRFAGEVEVSQITLQRR